jgi:predicted nucleic acid-binding protein
MKLFVDTGALAALSLPHDPHHRRATDFMASFGSEIRLSTSNLVFAETLNLLAARRDADTAVRFGESFMKSRLMSSVHYADEALELSALAVMRRYRDKRISFVDASTIALVKSEGLEGVFGFDSDFVRCGVPLFPRR